MKELKRLHDDLKSMQYDLNHYNTSLKDKFEMAGQFLENDLEDAISTIDDALDHIKELEDELNEANNKIDELESELDAAV